jgi:hypothetical protein
MAEQKKQRKRVPLFCLRVMSFFASIAPLGAVFVVKYDEYVGTVSEAVKLGFGAIAIVVFMVMKVLGKLKMPPRVVFYAMVLGFSYVFASLLEDLTLLSFMALAGEALDLFLFQPLIKRRVSERERSKVADATAERVEELFDKYIGGRV